MVIVELCCLFISLTCSALPPPSVSMSFSGESSAGQQYTINCSATVVSGLISYPDMMIVFSNSTVVSDMNTTSVKYTFSPLRTSDGGQYNCTATVNIPLAGIRNLSASTLSTTKVASMFSSYVDDALLYAFYFPFYSVPKPNVTLKGSLPFNSLYSATVFKLTCLVEFISHVNTPVAVLTTWRKNNEVVINGSRISVDSRATNSSVMTVYESSIVFDPLSNTRTGRDSGNYNCSVKIMDSEFVSGVSLNANNTLEVKGYC